MPATRVNLGLDTSGRNIYLSPRMKAAFDLTCERAGVVPVIVQGAFMAGNGAAASAGYHDGSGCIDTRVWNLTVAEQDALIREGRKVGWAIWLRDHRHGMDPHLHWLLLGEPDMAAGAVWQEGEYRAGRDGLATRGPDYHWRPTPIPTFDYEASQEDDMADIPIRFPDGKDRPLPKAIEHLIRQQDRIDKQLTRAASRDAALRAKVAEVRRAVDGNASADEIRALLNSLDAEITIVVNDKEKP